MCVCATRSVGRLPIHFHLRPFLHIYFHLFRLFIYGLLLSYAISSMSSSFVWISVAFFLSLSPASSLLRSPVFLLLLYYGTYIESSRVESTNEVHHSAIQVSATTSRLRIASQPSLGVDIMGQTVNLNHFECDAHGKCRHRRSQQNQNERTCRP